MRGMKNAYSYVRWSSAPQSEGSTEDRQTELAEKYCLTHGLTLVDTFTDPGVSAFRGANAKVGALRTFLNAVDAGAIRRGSYLLIEDLQRLSRMPARQAQRLLEDIVERGITVVTIKDGKHYDKDTLDDIFTLVMSLLRFDQTHKDSKHKGDMVKKGWDKARAEKPMFSVLCPSWLEPKADRSGFKTPNPANVNVKTVRMMFELAQSGMGSHLIAQKLNEKKRPTLGGAEHWEAAHVLSILKNEAVIGHYQQRKQKGNDGTFRRENYFPAIIDKNTFLDVQGQLASRRGSGGQKRENVVNLFSGLLFCGACKAKVRAVNGNRKHIYLRCKNAFAKQGCDAPPHPYANIEDALLRELFLLYDRAVGLEAQATHDPVKVLNAEIDDKRKRLENLNELVAAAGAAATSGGFAGTVKMITDLGQSIADLETQVAEVRNQPQIGDIADEAFRLWEEHKRLRATDGPELQALRLRMQAHIRMLLSRIVLTNERINQPTKTQVRMDLYGPMIDAWDLEEFERTADGLGAWCYYDTKLGEELTVERRNTKKRKKH